jgi:hypothetical protein
MEPTVQGIGVPPQPRWRRWLRSLAPALSLLGCVLLLCAIVAILASFGIDLQTQLGALVAFRPWGAAIQGVLIVLIGMRWSQVVDWGVRRQIVQQWEYERVLGARPKVMLFLLAYWLMVPVGPNALLRIFSV